MTKYRDYRIYLSIQFNILNYSEKVIQLNSRHLKHQILKRKSTYEFFYHDYISMNASVEYFQFICQFSFAHFVLHSNQSYLSYYLRDFYMKSM